MNYRIISENKTISTEVVSEKQLPVLSEDRLHILKYLAKNPSYPAEIARELRMQVQTVYYHIHLLEQSGLIKLLEFEEKKGGLAKKYTPSFEAVSVVLKDNWTPLRQYTAKPPKFLQPFISKTNFNAKMIVGSPDPHGKYRARGSEFSGLELAMWLGGFASFSYPLYFLDTEVRETTRRENLVLLGGPKVNMLMEEVNPFLPIRFEEKTFGIKSTVSGKHYGENVGFVEIAPNPFNKNKHVFVVAGSNHLATRVAVLALVKEEKKMDENNLFDSNVFAKVVQGFDEDGDGIVDAVEILE